MNGMIGILLLQLSVVVVTVYCQTTAQQDKVYCWSGPCLNGGKCNDLVNAYNCTCLHLFNGTNCQNDLSVYGCSVLPCLNGGTCLSQTDGSRNYKCVCVSGFNGINCENNIDECASSPCQHGNCIDGINNYTCNCTATGYTGRACADDINECLTVSVCGAGTCYNTQGSFTCQCPLGFDGSLCQNNINDCNSFPCQNGGVCKDGIASYNCTCAVGFEGTNCQTNTDDCKNVICPGQNTVCVDGINAHSCECKPGFTGSPGSCVDINECIPDPCRNGATCQNLENAYNCVCIPGFTGKQCQSDINECSPNPCRNSAPCQDLINGYSCTCLPGYSGRNCETDINECIVNNQPCRNGATCLDLVNAYSCNCTAGWTGRLCDQDIDECSSNPCLHGAVCRNYQNYYNCSCVLGYQGKNCETDINDCSPNPCQHNSSCQDLVNGYKCNCSDGWMGKNCSDEYDACSFAPCKNGATCTTQRPQKQYNCACLKGFSGQNCETNIDDCLPNSCTKPLVCFDGVANFSCACPIGYTGVNCSININECASNPCLNGGTCFDGIGNYSCTCRQTFVNLTKYGNGQKLEFLTGYTGRNCEIDIDECSLRPSICLNNGTCKAGNNGDYFCQCGPDINGIYTTGKNCELRTSYCESADVVKDDPPACKHGGTCVSGETTFSCVCAPGYTGVRCEVDINECESSPCRYNGTCHDEVNRYTCTCIPGITGPSCETDINECASNPCKNQGQCNDRINGYNCNCTDTGFNGTECQYNIDDCLILAPCVNNASCTDLIKDYKCNCFPGYQGKNCETDIDECASNPCAYNGTCTQRSIESRPNFSYFTAAGYDCSCIPGITGVNCEINIDDCINNTCQFGSTCMDYINYYTCKCAPGYRGNRCEIEINECDEYLPCRNGATCIDRIADYKCICSEFYNGKQYGGKNCTVQLTSCLSHNCQNGATCKPYLINETTNNQSYTCACQHGYTGQYCEIPTTLSFNNVSFISHTLSRLMNNTISIRFRTTLANGVLLYWDGAFGTTLFCTLELFNGMLYLSYLSGEPSSAASTKEYHFPYLLNDANWHTIEVVQTAMLSFELKSPKCLNNCSVVVSYTDGAPKLNLRFGLPKNSFQLKGTNSQSNWIGCMEDIYINGRVLTYDSLNTDTTSSVNVVDGCLRTEQCLPNTCNSRGTCQDLWNNFACVCNRPYYGSTCGQEYVAATFARGGNGSYASFGISSLAATLKTDVDMSFFFRTRKADGLIMFLGNQGTYITVELYQGYILSRIVLCSYRQAFYINQTLFNNGNQHMTRLQLKGNVFSLRIDTYAVSDSITPACNLSADFLYFGGKIPSALTTGRRKRATDFKTSVDSLPALSTLPKYIGTIQDIELNFQKLLFFPATGSSIVAIDTTSLDQGEVTDDICRTTPCEHNGTCTNVFFNDFNCSCPHGFIGKNCSELDFCKDDSCPANSECHTLPDGFECISTATFSGSTNNPTIVSYRRNINSDHQIREITFKLRTIVLNGHIMFIKNENGRFIRFELRGGNVLVIYKLDSGEAHEILPDLFIGDREWYTVSLIEVDGKKLELRVVGNGRSANQIVDLRTDAITLQALITSGTPVINLGFTSSFTPMAHHYYSGCLREARIGGILLPFYYQYEFIQFTTAQYFEVQSMSNLKVGCIGTGSECMYNQCQHGTSCVPDYYGYQCNCTGSGYDGNWCQTNINDCGAGVCNQGKCVDKINDFYCKCRLGYSGNRCQTSTNPCSPVPCLNNASCQQNNGTYTCDCGTSYVGQNCDVSASASCSPSPCKNNGGCQTLANLTPNFKCTCPQGYTGYLCETRIDFCKDLPCENGGNCTSTTTDYQCTCPAGFSGKNCSVNNDECINAGCQNGGNCVDFVGGYVCNCTENWTGNRCETDFNECQRNPCERGVCVNSIGNFSCNCANTGYEGRYCDKDVNECTTFPCQNNGTCSNLDGSYNCTCAKGYEGINCEIPNCNRVDCQNGSTCSINSHNQWQCNCVQHFFGQLCNFAGPCAYKPCNTTNTEQCEQENKVNGSYTCHCKTGWQGVRCDSDINECIQSPCEHSGTCTNTPGDYICTCIPGYTGKNCSTDIDDCAVQPCEHNAKCEDRVNDFYCDCNNTGYTNKTCSVDIDECAQGEFCINGICENTEGSYTCTCVAGYRGKTCTEKDPDYQKLNDDNNIMWYIIGPVVAVVLIAIIIVIIVFVKCVRSKRATRGTYSPSRQEITGSRVELGQVLKPPPEERLI